MARVTAPGRLHFGLFNVPVEPHGPRRSFGGVGLMIEQPGIVVTARPAETWQFEGLLASRAQMFALRFMESLPEAERRPYQVLVERASPEHTGLGVGTQLGLAAVCALAHEVGLNELNATDLAQRIGRGERSAIGVHGFERGGLIVEPGKLPGEDISPLLTRVELPDEWRVVVFSPASSGPWHGNRERQAFATAHSASPTDALCRIALLDLVPAAISEDLDGFGDAVHEFNRLAGEPFASSQGGTYASPETAELIAAIRGTHVRGVGQSSWGPAVFAIVGCQAEAESVLQRFRNRSPGIITRISAGRVLEGT